MNYCAVGKKVQGTRKYKTLTKGGLDLRRYTREEKIGEIIGKFIANKRSYPECFHLILKE